MGENKSNKFVNSHKLEFWSHECIFLGYSTSHKGYKSLSPSGRSLISKDVVFNELRFPYKELFDITPNPNPTPSPSTNFSPTSIPIIPTVQIPTSVSPQSPSSNSLESHHSPVSGPSNVPARSSEAVPNASEHSAQSSEAVPNASEPPSDNSDPHIQFLHPYTLLPLHHIMSRLPQIPLPHLPIMFLLALNLLTLIQRKPDPSLEFTNPEFIHHCF